MNTPHFSLIQKPDKRDGVLRLFSCSIAICFFVFTFANGAGLNEFPVPVQDTIHALTQGASITASGTSIILGETLYEVKINRDGVERHWTLDANGVPLTVSILPKEAPEAVQKTIQAQMTKAGALVEILRSYEGGKVVYEAVFHSTKGPLNFTIDAAGVITSREIPLNQVPPKVLRQSSRILKSATPAHCFYSEEDHEPYFTFLTTQSSGPRWVTLDAEGEFSEEEELITPEKIPEPIMNAIVQKIGNKDHIRTLQKKDEQSTHFEVWAFTAGKLTIFWVSSTGVISDVPPEN